LFAPIPHSRFPRVHRKGISGTSPIKPWGGGRRRGGGIGVVLGVVGTGRGGRLVRLSDRLFVGFGSSARPLVMGCNPGMPLRCRSSDRPIVVQFGRWAVLDQKCERFGWIVAFFDMAA